MCHEGRVQAPELKVVLAYLTEKSRLDREFCAHSAPTRSGPLTIHSQDPFFTGGRSGHVLAQETYCFSGEVRVLEVDLGHVWLISSDATPLATRAITEH